MASPALILVTNIIIYDIKYAATVRSLANIHYSYLILPLQNVTCRVVHVTIITVSSLDDWISLALRL
jgi:hypothetical protein